jgi:hypothetical protein
MLFIKANPNPLGRFGHQFYNHLTGYLLARALRCRYLVGSFSGNADVWNSHVSFLESEYACSQADACGFKMRKIYGVEGKEMTKNMLSHYYNMIPALELSGASIIELPFDQFPGILEVLLDFYYEEVAAILGSKKIRGSRRNEIALHIRRGDVSQSKSSSLYMDNRAYIGICQQITRQYPNDWPIVVYSEGGSEQFADLKYNLEMVAFRKVLIRASSESFDTKPCEDFYNMSSAKVLVSSYSTYSYCAQIVSHSLGQRFFLADKRSQMDNVSSAWLNCLRKMGATVVLT